jgi:hypothetical protein
MPERDTRDVCEWSFSIVAQALVGELEKISTEQKQEASAIHNLVRTHFGHFISCQCAIRDVRRCVCAREGHHVPCNPTSSVSDSE